MTGMVLSLDFKVEGKHLTPPEALKLAEDIEGAFGGLMIGKLKPAKFPVELLSDAVQALRDFVKVESAQALVSASTSGSMCLLIFHMRSAEHSR